MSFLLIGVTSVCWSERRDNNFILSISVIKKKSFGLFSLSSIHFFRLEGEETPDGNQEQSTYAIDSLQQRSSYKGTEMSKTTQETGSFQKMSVYILQFSPEEKKMNFSGKDRGSFSMY